MPLFAVLQILSLRHNRLTGTIPLELGRLSHLKTLYMEKNELEGTIPETLANLASLEELNLLGNKFEGALGLDHWMVRWLDHWMVAWLDCRVRGSSSTKSVMIIGCFGLYSISLLKCEGEHDASLSVQ